MSSKKSTTKAITGGAAQALLDTELELRAVADEYGGADTEELEVVGRLRDAALAFAAAWHACGAAGR